MNKLVIIGNGFDLAHGLKTSYNDFILWYLKEAFRIKYETRYYDDELITLDFKGFPKIDFSIITNLKELLSVLEKQTFNIIYKSNFLGNIIKNVKDYNWVDIEYEYYQSLIRIYEMLHKSEGAKKEYYSNQVLLLNNTLTSIKEILVEYLISIKTEEHNENPVISTHIKKLLDSVKIKDKKMVSPYTPQICFLNFNYTSTIEKYLNKYSTSEYHYRIINIHGNLKDKNSIIFGYGDMMDSNYENLENTNNKEFLKHVRHFYYLQRQNYHNLIKFIEIARENDKKYEVYIMGHSCGVSDRVLLSRIFNPSTCKKIQIFYHQISENENDFFEKTQNISRHLSKEDKVKIELICNKAQCVALS